MNLSLKLSLLIAFLPIFLFANNLEITEVTQNGNQVSFEISWDNSWRSTLEFHDAVWVFIKQAPNGGPSWTHANISSGMIDQGYEVIIPSDQVGVFVRRASNGNGTSSAQVQLTIENPTGAYRDYKVFGIEMVYVPEGPFYLGDGYSEKTFFEGGDTLSSYHIESEDAIPVGDGPGEIDADYVLDLSTQIPSHHPKGYAEFYCMKYNVTQSQFVDFLNCLPRLAQDNLTESDLSGTTTDDVYVLSKTPNMVRDNGVRCDNNIGTGPIFFYCDLNENEIPNESDDGQSKICNYLSPYGLKSYADWSGLAPMTKFEWEKACRGPLPPIANEYAWGSTTLNEFQSSDIINNGELNESLTNSIDGPVMNNTNSFRVGMHAIWTPSSRLKSGSTYYGIMEMTGQFHSSMIKLSQPSILLYDGEHGDGTIPSDGITDFLGFISFTYTGFNNGAEGCVSSNSAYSFIYYDLGYHSLVARYVRRL